MFRLLSLSILVVWSVGIDHAFADKHWDSKYVSDVNTTMEMSYRGDDKISISGRGRYSTYRATCRRSGTDSMTCTGTGTRSSDNKVYQGTYEISSTDGGKTITSSWRAVYANGEKFNGTTKLTRVRMTELPVAKPAAPYRGTREIAGSYQAEGSRETMRISNSESDPFNIEIELGKRAALVSGSWIPGQIGSGFRFKVDGAEFTGIFEPKSRLIFIRQGGKTIGSFRKR